MCRQQLSQIFFRFRKPAPAHVDVGQTHDRIRRPRVERQCLFVFLLGRSKLIFLLKKFSRGKMRLSLLRLQRRRALVCRQRLLRFRLFDGLPERKPGPVLTFGHVRRGF